MPEESTKLWVNSEEIVILRNQLGWSQAELARRAGISQSVLSRLERSDPAQDFTLSNLTRVAEAFQQPVSRLLNDPFYVRQQQLPQVDVALAAVLGKLAKLNPASQRQAAFILEGYLLSFSLGVPPQTYPTDLNLQDNS